MAHRIWLALVGALGFWLPLVVLETLWKHGDVNLVAANALPVLTFACVYGVLRTRHQNDGRLLPIATLVGIYALGPLMIWLTWSAHGGGFAATHGPRAALWLLLFTVVPPFTFYLATWNGTLVAVLVVSLALARLATAPRSRA